jgi:hypothetical protein
MFEFIQCARKIGFDILICTTTPDVVRALKLVFRKHKGEGIKTHFDSSSSICSFTTGELRGE